MPDLATISALTAQPGLQQIKLSWDLTDPNSPGGLPYLICRAVQVVVSPVNDRNDSGAETFDAELTGHVVAGLPEEVQQYFWVRPRFGYIPAGGDATQAYYGGWVPS